MNGEGETVTVSFYAPSGDLSGIAGDELEQILEDLVGQLPEPMPSLRVEGRGLLGCHEWDNHLWLVTELAAKRLQALLPILVGGEQREITTKAAEQAARRAVRVVADPHCTREFAGHGPGGQSYGRTVSTAGRVQIPVAILWVAISQALDLITRSSDRIERSDAVVEDGRRRWHGAEWTRHTMGVASGVEVG